MYEKQKTASAFVDYNECLQRLNCLSNSDAPPGISNIAL